MNKLFTKVATLCVGLAMAAGVGVAVGSSQKVSAAFADSVEGFVCHAAGNHLVVEVVVAHVARPAVAVRHHHDLLHAQLVDGDNEAAHRRVEGRNHEAAGVLDDFRVAVFQSERGGQQLRQPRVHARQHRQLLVGVLVGEVFLVAFLFYKTLVESDNLVDHNPMKFELQKYENRGISGPFYNGKFLGKILLDEKRFVFLRS